MTPFRGSFEDAGMELAAAIERSVAGSVGGHRRVAVAFSGGLDSSVITACARRYAAVVACSAYAEGAHDDRNAGKAAEALGVELVTTRLTREAIAEDLEAIDLPFEPSLMDKSLWCLYSVVSRSAMGAGAGAILLGQLADELFGGYAKYQVALGEGGEWAAELLMNGDVGEYGFRGRVRDVKACSRWLEPRFPFEAKEVMELGLSMPVSYKIRRGVRKAVLREAAVLLGVPAELASVAKKAAQYSSGIQKIVR